MIEGTKKAPVRVIKGSMRYLKAVVKCIIALQKLLKDSIKSRLARRDAKLKDLDDAIQLYYDVCKGWVASAIKKPVISILQDPELNFNFSDPLLNDNAKEQRLMKLKVRVKGII